MKQFLGMRIAVLPDAPVMDGILHSTEVEKLQEARDVRTHARQAAARLLHEARRRRDETHRKADAVLQAARAQAQQEAAAIAEQARAQAISDAVEWQVDLADLERVVARRLESNLRALLAQTVSAVLGECEAGVLLAQRIASRVAQMSFIDPVELRVEASSVGAVKALFEGRPEVTVVVDPVLDAHQATLHSGLMTVRFDLRQHLDQVLNSLRLQPPTEGE